MNSVLAWRRLGSADEPIYRLDSVVAGDWEWSGAWTAQVNVGRQAVTWRIIRAGRDVPDVIKAGGVAEIRPEAQHQAIEWLLQTLTAADPAILAALRAADPMRATGAVRNPGPPPAARSAVLPPAAAPLTAAERAALRLQIPGLLPVAKFLGATADPERTVAELLAWSLAPDDAPLPLHDPRPVAHP